MRGVVEQTGLLVDMIKKSNEYNQYQMLLKKVMQDQGSFNRLNEFRRKNFILQMNSNADAIDSGNALYHEYADVVSRPDVKEFLSAEQRYIRMIRQIYRTLDENVNINIDFLEE